VDNAGRNQRPHQDTNLYEFSVSHSKKMVKLSKISSLPLPELERPEWNSHFEPQKRRSHDIRARSTDLDNDGHMDVLIFASSRPGKTTSDQQISSIQFLRNLGNGRFKDVSNEKLYGFNFLTHPSYQPLVKDLDNDGDDDVFVSGWDWHGFADSTDILLHDAEGRFVSVGSERLSEAMPVHATQDIATILIGPGGQIYFIRHMVRKRRGQTAQTINYRTMEIVDR
jgi:hypothetical protein